MSEQKNVGLVEGQVVSSRHSYVVVKVVRRVRHPLYGKYQQRSVNYHAHTERECQVGEVVSLKQIAPVSKKKCWQVVSIATNSDGDRS